MDAERTQATPDLRSPRVTAPPAFTLLGGESGAGGFGIDDETIAAAVRLAGELQREAAAAETAAERRARFALGRLVDDRRAMAAATILLDVAVRPTEPARVATAITHVLADAGLPAVSARDAALLVGFRRLWRLAPRLAVGLFTAHLRARTRTLVRSGEPAALHAYLAQRRVDGVTVNLNLVGEAVLGPDEAERRLAGYEAALADPAVAAIAVKLSSLVAGVHPLAFDHVVDAACAALRRLYRAAQRHGAQVSLDMEEFRDLEPTLAAYLRVSAEAEFAQATHGIALQAYLPDSSAALDAVIVAAQARVAAGGAPLRVRLVKGANLAAERQQAAVEGWVAAPFPDKAAVDAHFRRMLSVLLQPAHAAVVHVGVASHNVFDVALALTLAERRATTDALCLEMLEGMSEPLRRVARRHHPHQLVYAPVATDDDFLAAIAYLIRRFDEQTGEANFLRQNFRLQVGDVRWAEQRRRFVAGAQAAAVAPTESRRGAAGAPAADWPGGDPAAAFANLASADWALAPVRERLRAALANPPEVSVRPATVDDVGAAVATAAADPDGWAQWPLAQRRAILLDAARRLARQRPAAWSLLAHEAHKTPAEADPEVCEAVDALAWYARSLDALDADTTLRWAPNGVVAVLPPFNFPLAIPLGGIAAALIGGNRVVVKPSPATPACALLACEVLWAAGVPRSALHLVHGGPELGAALAGDPRTAAIVFTGSTATAQRILAANPSTPLLAETGGKNVQIVTATADRDLAIANIIRGGFSHAGQKCSASSLVIAEAEVFDDPSFRRRLVDAARVLRCGPATDPATDVAPLVQAPNPALAGLLAALPAGESWALTPDFDGDRRCSPGIVWDVQPGSATHLAELFGPVLGVMRADDLDAAIALVHASGYGLTSGLQSLDRDEWAHWAARLAAGNLYVNRPSTGAVVGRQPFGGWGRSGFGAGAKAGGPHYAAELVTVAPRTGVAGLDYGQAPLARLDDPAAIPGQRNVWRFRPVPGVVLRIEAHDDPADVRGWEAAAAASGAAATVSRWSDETGDQLAERLRSGAITRVIRTGTDVEPAVRTAAARNWVWVAARPRTGTDADLRLFVREQTVSADVHRHGWVAPGADDLGWLAP